MAIEIPPWLQPQDIPGQYSRGLAIGQQQAMQTQRIQAEAASQAAEMGYKQAAEIFKQQQEARLEQQDANEKARWEAEYGLKASAAAEKHRAIQGYQQAIAGGMDPTDAILKFGPSMGQQASPEAAAIRSQMTAKRPPIQAPSVAKFADEDFLMVPGPDGRVTPHQIHHAPEPKSTEGKLTQQDRAKLQTLGQSKRALEKKLSEGVLSTGAMLDDRFQKGEKIGPESAKVYAQWKIEQGKLDKIMAQIAAIEGGNAGQVIVPPGLAGKSAAPGGITAPPGSFAPAPRDPSQRESGKTYMTPKGPHTWTGTGWEVYANESSD